MLDYTITIHSQQQQPPPPSLSLRHYQHHSANDRNGNSGIAAITAAPMPTGSAMHDHQQQQHIEIGLDVDDAMHEKDIEHGGSGKRLRHRSHHRRPLFRRVFNYLRHAWTGVKFSSSTGKLFTHLKSCFFFSSDLFVVGTRVSCWIGMRNFDEGKWIISYN